MKNLTLISLVIILLTITGCGGSFFPGVTLKSIQIDPHDSVDTTITSGHLQKFVATGTYSDGSMKDLTTQVDWATSDFAVAQLDSVGYCVGGNPGTATITATYQNVVGTLQVTIVPRISQ